MTHALIPVIAGVGEVVDRTRDPALSPEPLALMQMAVMRALDDATGLPPVDSLDVVQQTSWRYTATARRLADRLGISPARAELGRTGGETPVRAIHGAARRIAAGQCRVACVVGGEAQYAVTRAQAAGVALDWTPQADTIDNPLDLTGLFHPLALAHGVLRPAEIYPLYENATLAAWGQMPEQAAAESARLWAGLSQVAHDNPYAWSQAVRTAADIGTPSATNRLVAWPYTKAMVANPQVNQGAAVLLTSLACARAAGIADDRLVFVTAGIHANAPRDYLARQTYAAERAQSLVLRAAASQAGPGALLEIYSCFPVVPKMAAHVMQLGPEAAVSVTGGLSFFGGPFNTYMTHAACAMTRALRHGPGQTGILYGQGEFVTKHYAVTLARQPGTVACADVDLQDEALDDAAAPTIAPDYTGPAMLETHTVIFDRDGAPPRGVVVARTPDGRRTLARVAPDDEKTIVRLMSRDRSPVGSPGLLGQGAGGLQHWRFS